MFTENQKSLMKFLCSVGYGYANFACSVERSGKCTEKQELTMIKMKRNITEWRAAHRHRSRECYDVPGGIGCSDTEAMSMGEFF